MDAGFIVGEKGIAEGDCHIGLCCNFLGHLENLATSIGGALRGTRQKHPELHGFYKGYKPPTQWNPSPLVGNQTHVLKTTTWETKIKQATKKKNRSAKEVILNSVKPH